MDIQTNQLSNVLAEIGKLGASSLDSAINETSTKLDELIATTSAKLTGLEKNRPTLQVQINAANTAKLTSTAVPYLQRLILNAKTGENTLLVGPAGCGKSTAAEQLAQALELQFSSICFTSGASETWLFGRHTPTGFVEGEFQRIYRQGGVFLADEIDAADGNLLLSINTALANGFLVNPYTSEKVIKHKDFVCIGAANTFGTGADHVYTGRNRLDGATLDRFWPIEISYSKEIEKLLCPNAFINTWLTRTREKLAHEGFTEILSSRRFKTAYLQYSNGLPIQEIFKSIALSWDSEARQLLEYTYIECKKEATELEADLRVTDITKVPKSYTIGKAKPSKKAAKPKVIPDNAPSTSDAGQDDSMNAFKDFMGDDSNTSGDNSHADF